MRFSAPILALLALLMPFRPAAADWEYTKWGMTPEQVVKASHGTVQLTKARPAGENANFELKADGTFGASGLHFDASFGFDNSSGGLVFVTYAIDDPLRNGLLKEWLIRKYGQPQNRQGADDVETWTWNRPGMDLIELDIPEGGPGFVIQYPPGG
jgi:hypothetical protein